MVLELILVPGDDLVRRVGDQLVIEAPALRRCPGRRVGSEGNVVALPRVRLHVLDLPLRVVAEERVGEVSGTGIDLPVRKGARRARELIDVIPALPGLPAGQDFAS